ncbi:flap endonuclease Xni [Vibrio sp.]|nr:flap endonuclease Xni [Vibrio sp.]
MSDIHVVILDALNLIRRVHSAQPDPNDIPKTIESTSFTLRKILKEHQPTHIIAVFDHHEQDRGWRAELLPDYKSKRKPMPDALLKGLDTIQQAWWQTFGIDSLLSEGDEADDLIATIAKKVASRQQKATIISTDKGYSQLLAPTLYIRDYFQHRWLDVPFIEKEFGVKIEQMADYWGLVGISSSQVPGIPGVGPKAAKEILSQFPDIESAYQSSELIPKYRKKFDEHIELARTCKKIATLKTDIPLGFNLQDIRFTQQ